MRRFIDVGTYYYTSGAVMPNSALQLRGIIHVVEKHPENVAVSVNINNIAAISCMYICLEIYRLYHNFD